MGLKKRRILAHVCCGPCSITVLQDLLDKGHSLEGLFYNPNVQPLAEQLRRREGAGQVARRLGLPLIYGDALEEAQQIWDDPWRLEDDAGGPIATKDSGKPPLPPLPPLPPAVDPVPWLRAVAGKEAARCTFCVRLRLAFSARLAAERGFEAFTTTLLYSRYQKHEEIRALGEECAARAGISFYYEDFRVSWREGARLARDWNIYRQPYCGCLFSEYERYAAALDRARAGA